MKFKTNARCGGCRKTILDEMNRRFPNAQWEMEVETADKVLQCHGMPENSEEAAKVEAAIAETGFKGSWIRPDGY